MWIRDNTCEISTIVSEIQYLVFIIDIKTERNGLENVENQVFLFKNNIQKLSLVKASNVPSYLIKSSINRNKESKKKKKKGLFCFPLKKNNTIIIKVSSICQILV